VKEIPVSCPICDAQLNIDDEYMARMYDEWEQTLSITFWVFYCSAINSHRGFIGELRSVAEQLKETQHHG